jgi:hypothetical protein
VTNGATHAARRAIGSNQSLPTDRSSLLATATLVDLVVVGVDQHFEFVLSAPRFVRSSS